MLFDLINPLECFFDIEDHVAVDRNLGTGCNTIILRLIQGDLYSARPYRQFHYRGKKIFKFSLVPRAS